MSTCTAVVTEASGGFGCGGIYQAIIDRLTTLPPLERLATPVDIAGAVVAPIAGPDRWIRGQVIYVSVGII